VLFFNSASNEKLLRLRYSRNLTESDCFHDINYTAVGGLGGLATSEIAPA
jgi:hypothetical protein